MSLWEGCSTETGSFFSMTLDNAGGTMSPTASTLGPPEKSGKMTGRSCVGEQMKSKAQWSGLDLGDFGIWRSFLRKQRSHTVQSVLISIVMHEAPYPSKWISSSEIRADCNWLSNEKILPVEYASSNSHAILQGRGLQASSFNKGPAGLSPCFVGGSRSSWILLQFLLPEHIGGIHSDFSSNTAWPKLPAIRKAYLRFAASNCSSNFLSHLNPWSNQFLKDSNRHQVYQCHQHTNWTSPLQPQPLTQVLVDALAEVGVSRQGLLTVLKSLCWLMSWLNWLFCILLYTAGF